MQLIHWEQFLTERKTERKNESKPPQGKGAAPYCAPHAANDGKVKVRVCEKSKEGFGDEATPALKDPDRSFPRGKKPSYADVVEEAKKVLRFNGKINEKVPVAGDPKPEKNKHILRGTQKSEGKPFGDLSSSCFKKPEDIAPLGMKPEYSKLTTEQFVQQTSKLSNTEFVQAMLNESEEDPRFEPVECAVTGKKFFPTAHECARYMARMLPENARARRVLINELKSSPGGMSALMSELVGHSETYNEMVNQIGLGETKVANRFVKAMQENHDKFMTEMGLMSGIKESVNVPISQRFGHQMSRPPVDAAPGEDDPPPEAFDDPTMIQDMPGDGQDSVDEVPPKAAQNNPLAKLNKEFAYHHMVREMSKFPNMMEVMRHVGTL